MRRTSLALVACLIAAACGSRVGPPERATAPQHVQATPGALPDSTSMLPTPTPVKRGYVVTFARPMRFGELRRLVTIPGAAVVARVSVKTMPVKGKTGVHRLRVAKVDPLQYRSVAPRATRDADFVWTALLAGAAVVTFESAKRLGLKDSGELTLGGRGPIPIGAFADNSTPNLADVLVSTSLGDWMEMNHPSVAVVGSRPGANLDKLGNELRKRLPGARLTSLAHQVPGRLGRPPAPIGGAGAMTIEEMTFRILESGFIDPDPGWVEANIATATVPILGEVTCHRLMFFQLSSALAEIAREGLGRLIDPGDYGGCYVPRFIDRDPTKPLSMHAFGLAVDINVSDNQLNTLGNMDPRVVSIFERWGFEWGGRWSRPDPMHFELDRVMRP